MNDVKYPAAAEAEAEVPAAAAASVAAEGPSPWLSMSTEEAYRRLSMLHEKLARGVNEPALPIANRLIHIFERICADLPLLMKRRMGKRLDMDAVDDAADERPRMLDVTLSLLAFCMSRDVDASAGMQKAQARMNEHIASLSAIRQNTDFGSGGQMAALSRRLAHEIMSFNHRWRISIDYKVVENMETMTLQMVFDQQLSRERIARLRGTDKEEKEATGPKPYLYASELTEQEKKSNPLLSVTFGMPADDLLSVCTFHLGRLSLTPQLSDHERAFMRLASWHLLSCDFTSWIVAKLGPPQPSAKLLSTEKTISMRRHFIGYVLYTKQFERDSNSRAICNSAAYGLTAPLGTDDLYCADIEIREDLFPPRLRNITANWLERTGDLYSAWLGVIYKMGYADTSTALASGDTLMFESHFYEQFHYACRLLVNGLDISHYVFFPHSLTTTYPQILASHTDEIPASECRPVIFLLAKRVFLKVRTELFECESLSAALICWLYAICARYDGMDESGDHNFYEFATEAIGMNKTEASSGFARAEQLKAARAHARKQQQRDRGRAGAF